MIHNMHLHPEPLEKIRAGHKTIELRLYDEKRQRIQVGDKIVFTNAGDKSDTLLVEVLNIYWFSSFVELYKVLPLQRCGYEMGEQAYPSDMELYYTKDEQEQYGVLGIEFKLV